MDFSKFDKEINAEQLQKDIEEAGKNAGGYDEVPDGEYIVKIEKMEVGLTTQTKEPCFKVQCRIVEDEENEGKFKKHCIFFNRKIYGNKVSDSWNDGRAISTVTGWLAKLESETPVVFENYSQFSDLVLDLFEECEEYGLTFRVEYEADAFNPISILEVIEG